MLICPGMSDLAEVLFVPKGIIAAIGPVEERGEAHKFSSRTLVQGQCQWEGWLNPRQHLSLWLSSSPVELREQDLQRDGQKHKVVQSTNSARGGTVRSQVTMWDMWGLRTDIGDQPTAGSERAWDRTPDCSGIKGTLAPSVSIVPLVLLCRFGSILQKHTDLGGNMRDVTGSNQNRRGEKCVKTKNTRSWPPRGTHGLFQSYLEGICYELNCFL